MPAAAETRSPGKRFPPLPSPRDEPQLGKAQSCIPAWFRAPRTTVPGGKPALPRVPPRGEQHPRSGTSCSAPRAPAPLNPAPRGSPGNHDGKIKSLGDQLTGSVPGEEPRAAAVPALRHPPRSGETSPGGGGGGGPLGFPGIPGWDGGSHNLAWDGMGGSHNLAWKRRGSPPPASHPPGGRWKSVRGCTPFPPQDPTQDPAPYLVYEDIDGRVEGRAALGGHGEEAEAHADIEPLTDAGAVQRLVLRLGRVSGRFLARLCTWGRNPPSR